VVCLVETKFQHQTASETESGRALTCRLNIGERDQSQPRAQGGPTRCHSHGGGPTRLGGGCKRSHARGGVPTRIHAPRGALTRGLEAATRAHALSRALTCGEGESTRDSRPREAARATCASTSTLTQAPRQPLTVDFDLHRMIESQIEYWIQAMLTTCAEIEMCSLHMQYARDIYGWRTTRLAELLTEVKHDPNLRKNLISIRMLDSKECNFDASGGTLRVSKRNKEMLWGKKTRGLYRLERSVQIGGAIVRHGSNDISKENGQRKQSLHRGTQSKRRGTWRIRSSTRAHGDALGYVRKSGQTRVVQPVLDVHREA
ncbi:Voltage-dependent P/Q-type calcium channel subunit alpha-1A like, partial [Actinidia chinensis var. chinensis]